MLKKTVKTSIFSKVRASVLTASAFALVVGFTVSNVVHVQADQYDEQINALNNENSASRAAVGDLANQAGSYQQAIDQLQQQIDAVRAQISANQAKQASLQQQITDAQNKINEQKKFLAQDLKAMYIDGQLSTIEELATSKSLSEYVDKEAYRTSVQNKINALIRQINAMQQQLQKQKTELDQLVASQEQQNAQLASAQAQQQQLLSYNQSQQDAFNSKIAANTGKIADLRKQQLAANARFIGGGGAPGTGPTCGGGYPAKWCNAPQDSLIDDWGMYNRECVSYTAFKVWASGRYMPYWGGIGNANQWDDNAARAGIPVDSSPRPGDVAISNSGYYGHAMYVESVNGNGTINISQYNAALDGRYSTRSGMSTAGLVFIHF